MEPQRVAYVDSLRCVAASAVLAQHLFERVDPVTYAGLLDSGPGVFGVVLFFYISGLVIPLSVQKRPPAIAFAIRRIFRIYPAYLAALGLITLLALVQHQTVPLVAAGFFGSVANLLLLHEFLRIPAILGVTWTLALEFVWYGIFALIFYRASGARVSWLVIALALGLTLLSLVSLRVGIRVPAGRIGLIGAALVGYLTSQNQAGMLRAYEYAVTVVTFLSAMLFSLYVAFGIYSHPTIRLHHSLIPWSAASLLFLVSTRRGAVALRNALSWQPLVFLGAISYSIYLLHGPLIGLFIGLPSANAAIAASIAATIIAAWLFHRFVELPGVRLGKRLERGWTARRPAAAEDNRAYVQSSQ